MSSAASARAPSASALQTAGSRRVPPAARPGPIYVGGRSPLPDALGHQPGQSTATSRAAQMSRIRESASLPSRLMSMPTEALSTESKLTAERRGIGSPPGSRTTSLARPRIVVVHGATSARRSRGITASRESTTTGRRPISGGSHHHTSPRAGSALTRQPQLAETTPGLPTRPARRTGIDRRQRSLRPPLRNGDERATPPVPRRRGRRQWLPGAPFGRCPGAPRPRSYSIVCGSCHNYATASSRECPGATARRNESAVAGELTRRGR